MAPVIWVAGSVVSRADAALAAETEGRLVWVVESGTAVKKGQVLARIDVLHLNLLLEEHKAKVRRASAQQVYLQQEVQRLGRLAGQNNAARTQLDRLEADYAVADADLALVQAQLKQSQNMIDRAEVRAPFDGIIAQQLMQMGEWAAKGQVLLRLIDPLSLEIMADAPLTSLPFLLIGDKLLVHDGRVEREARLRTLTTAAASRSRQLALRLDINPGGWLVGQSLRVAVPAAARRRLMSVPRDALVMRRSGIAVFRVNENSEAERVEVVTGIAEGDLIAISGAIRAGDQVIVRGSERLRPGQAVNVSLADKMP